MSIFTNPGDGAREVADAYIEAVLDLLGDEDPYGVLSRQVGAVEELIRSFEVGSLGIEEAPGKWSALELVQHLADSELVWACRLRFVVGGDRPALTGYDQDQWARRLRYAEASMEEALAQLRLLRAMNLRLLGQLDDDDLERVGVHGERGEESVAQMIRLYAGHDLVHLRQLRRIREAVAS